MNTMKTKENVNNSKFNFFQSKGIIFLLVFLMIILLSIFILIFFNRDKQTSNKKNSPKTTTDYSIEKVVCYSSCYGVNKEETQARWNLDLSQYTDIAIYLNLQNDVNSLFVDNITFSNIEENTFHLMSLPIEDFGKTPSGNISVEPLEKIKLSTDSPITLRYLNQNFKEDCVITDIETPLVFDGSLLKRGKVTLSSLKNTVSFTLHLIDSSGKEFTYPIQIPINLENKETGETIYSGNYMEENFLTNAYFYILGNYTNR